jgi:RimJ/RimL family protein N-acetyltransferase
LPPGFALEGTLRRVLFFDGCWHDVALYGILRDEWVASGPKR